MLLGRNVESKRRASSVLGVYTHTHTPHAHTYTYIYGLYLTVPLSLLFPIFFSFVFPVFCVFVNK